MQPTCKIKNEHFTINYKPAFNDRLMKFIFSAIASLLLISTTAFAQKTYTLDKNHAKVGFSAVHFGISHVEGNFKINLNVY